MGKVRTTYVVAGVAFVPHPLLRGMWLRTDISVVSVDCPHCLSVRGVPCRSHTGNYTSGTHYLRRRAATAANKPMRERQVIVREFTVKTPDLAAPTEEPTKTS